MDGDGSVVVLCYRGQACVYARMPKLFDTVNRHQPPGYIWSATPTNTLNHHTPPRLTINPTTHQETQKPMVTEKRGARKQWDRNHGNEDGRNGQL